jgi:predicted unusual protein kinase regulating ubiquinone biosynthesis (AarF/ABC1/UbiB family)
VPKSRFGRLSRMGAMATSVAGGMIAEGARQLASGKRPKVRDMLLIPSNARRVASQLSKLRGAAMKVGQLLSMDAGDFLPPEFAEVLATLRSDARSMPRKQLLAVLTEHWGPDWASRLYHFDEVPIAAASIGQVHQASVRGGERLAIKIQYPGVSESIDSDIDNVAGLLRMTGLVPKSFDLKPLLSQAKAQLHEEADYLREAECLRRYKAALGALDGYLIPEVYEQLTTSRILAMSFVEGFPVESFAQAPQEVRNHLVTRMLDLLFRELFSMHVMQTDPNFANYLYQPDSGQLVLMDFGATRDLPFELVKKYARMVQAGLRNNKAQLVQAGLDIGYFDQQVQTKHKETILELMRLSVEPLKHDSYHFGTTDLAMRVREAGFKLGRERDFWHVPPIDSMFIHRKVGGVFLLATRLKAQVKVRALYESAVAGLTD